MKNSIDQRGCYPQRPKEEGDKLILRAETLARMNL